MNLRATADLHGHLPAIPDCDVLIIAGDVCPDMPSKAGKYELADIGADLQFGWLQETFKPWLLALKRRGIFVVGIAGNHDFVFERFHSAGRQLPWAYLRDSTVVVDGLRIYGTPWVPGLPRWAFHGTEASLRASREMIPDDTDILVSHGPPYGTADFTCPRFGSMHVGDRHLTAAIGRIQPRAVVCGHIHEGRGVHSVAGVPVYNVACADENYDKYRAPMRIVEVN